MPTRSAALSFDRLNAYPSALQGRTNSYQYYYDNETGQRNDRISKARITFDFNADYQEDLLIHTQSGGGDLSASVPFENETS